MPPTKMFPSASGNGIVNPKWPKSIRFLLQGCRNRPFYHIVVAHAQTHQTEPVIEQLGSYDPLPNKYNEKLVALNLERIQYWLGNGATVTKPVAELFGLAGFFPIHPRSYMTAWRNREQFEKAKELETKKKLEKEEETEQINGNNKTENL